MSIFLCLQSTYNAVELALFQHEKQIIFFSLNKEHASAQLIVHIQQILAQQSCALSELDFIVVNQGPAPFTTLRTVIATANGISYASRIPLIGVDGLKAFAQSFKNSKTPLVVLLNAFSNAVYYGITSSESEEIETGYAHIDQLITFLCNKDFGSKPFTCIGNGASMHQECLKKAFEHIHFPHPLPAFCSLDAIADQAISLWQQKRTSTSLMPLYLKRAVEK